MTVVSLPILQNLPDRGKIRTIIRALEADAAAKVFACHACVHLGSDSDGGEPEYAVSWSTCERDRALSEHKLFPFKVAPATCFKLSSESTPLAELLFENYPDAHSGVFALSRSLDARGRLAQSPLTDATIDAVYAAMTDPILWVTDARDEGYAETDEWRGIKGHVSPAPDNVRAKCGMAVACQFNLVGWGVDLLEQGDLICTSRDQAQSHAEINMRVIAIARVVAELTQPQGTP